MSVHCKKLDTSCQPLTAFGLTKCQHSSSVGNGGAMGHLHPQPKLLGTR